VSEERERFTDQHATLVSLMDQFSEYLASNKEVLYKDFLLPDYLRFHVGNQEEEEEEEDWDLLASVEGREEKKKDDCEVRKEVEEDRPITPTEVHTKKNQYIDHLWIQSESDLGAAEWLQSSNRHHAQAVFYYQQASEKALKAVLLSMGYGFGVNSSLFKSHDLYSLVDAVVHKQEYSKSKMQVLRSASLLEAVASKEKRKRFVCLRARYAVANVNLEINTFPWFVFQSEHAVQAAEHAWNIVQFCEDQFFGLEEEEVHVVNLGPPKKRNRVATYLLALVNKFYPRCLTHFHLRR
jgi:HEPN domain-containing protein